MAFRDLLDITVQGGKGGDGGLSFLRLKYVPKGGPDGGRGGDGGSVYLEAIDDLSSLERLVGQQHHKAGTGAQGEGRDRDGARGEDLVIRVPIGTTATDLDSGEVLADLLEVGQRALIAKGGLGGRGNAAFASARRRAPRFAEYGTPGEKRRVRLELRMIADAGLVGYPNAGKTSLLAALSNARPLIASYPFTTLSPNLGVLERSGSHDRLTLADIPGIIEDAHQGKGLGLEFLRHISRTRLLVFVLDIAEEPVEAFQALRHELNEYDPTLLELPALVVLNKIDLASETEAEAEVADLARFGLPVVTVSAERGDHLSLLEETLFEMVPQAPRLAPAPRGTKRLSARPTTVRRDRSGEGWVVTGSEIEALVGRFDPTNPDAVAYLQHFFERMGVSKLLAQAGAQDGDNVTIGDAVFEYFSESAEASDDEDEGEAAGDEDGEAEAVDTGDEEAPTES